MFFHNGFVYGGKPAGMIKVVNAKPLPDSMMIITFNSGETRLFDASILDGPVFQRLKEDEVFFYPEIDHGVVTWDNGAIDCAPEYMFEHSYEYAQEAIN